MKCPNCESEEARKILTTQAVKDYKGGVLIIDKVPLISCKNCGESFYSPDAVKKMDEIRKHPERASEKTMKFVELETA